jgi:RIO-like serine/threonine protein kinase
MSYHLRVLQSLVKLSRSNSAPSRAVLLNRAGGTDTALGDAVDTLVALGLVQVPSSDQHPLRLTLQGLAVGTAYAAQAARQAEETAAVSARSLGGGRRERRSVPRTVDSRAA